MTRAKNHNPSTSWVMPEWMIPFEEADLIAGHGGNGVIDLMCRFRDEKNLAFTNIVVFTMACEVSAQVGLLHRLRDAGLLADAPPQGFLTEYSDQELGEAAEELERGPYRPTVKITYPTLNMHDGTLSQTTSPSMQNTASFCEMLNDEMVGIVRYKRAKEQETR